MDFMLSEEQKMIRENIRDFLEKEIAPIANERDLRGPLSKEEVIDFTRRLKPFGFGFTPEIFKQEMSLVNYFASYEELCRVWCSLAAAIGWSLSSLSIIFAPPQIRERLLPRLNAGELLGAFAFTEPNAGSDTRSIQTRATLDGDHYIINGTKSWITNGTIADILVVLATDESGARQLFLVDKELSPFQTRELPKMGWRACPTGEIYLDNCHVPKECNLIPQVMNLFSKKEGGESLKEYGLDIAKVPPRIINLLGKISPLHFLFSYFRTGLAIMGVALCQAALDTSVSYAKERIQFGKPIGRFQLVQNIIYEMLCLTEASHFLAYHSVEAINEGDEGVRWISSLAKGFASEAAIKVTYDAMQLHGAMGISEEYPLERYYRDARILTIGDGTTEIQKLIVGREILGMSALV